MECLNAIWQDLVKSRGVPGLPLLRTPGFTKSASDKRGMPSRPPEKRLEPGCAASIDSKRRSLSREPGCRADSETEKSMSMIKSKVMVVDDEESIRNLMKVVLTRERREVLLASRGRDAIEMFQRERPDITILDIAMPDLNGIEVLRRIRALDHGATVMVFTGSSTEALVKQVQELGVTEVLEKGSSLSAIMRDSNSAGVI